MDTRKIKSILAFTALLLAGINAITHAGFRWIVAAYWSVVTAYWITALRK